MLVWSFVALILCLGAYNVIKLTLALDTEARVGQGIDGFGNTGSAAKNA